MVLAGYTDGGTVEVFDNGVLGVGGHARPGMTLGSIEGGGFVRLTDMTVNGNNVQVSYGGSNGLSLTVVP